MVEDEIIEEENTEDLSEEDEDFSGSFDDEEDSDEYNEEYDSEEELFRENPLKALWIRQGEIKEMLQNGD